jgi:predicted PurR-regulated permease PerM
MTLATFTGRFLVVVIITALALALWKLSDVGLLLFGAILLAVGLSAVARLVSRHTGAPRTLALAGVLVVGLALAATTLWVFGAAVAAQLSDVARQAPAGLRVFTGWLNGDLYGRLLLDQMRGANVLSATGWATSVFAATAGLITGALGYAVIALFVGFYLATQPALYHRLCLRLVPPAHRPVAEQLLSVVGKVLEHWLIGQLVVMLTIGVLTGIGLSLLGIEAAVALGLMGGLLCFIPFVGAILAAVPATLVALTQGPIYAASVIGMYAAVHFVEGNFITPLVQAEATSLPPVLGILSTVAFGILFGPLGVLLAVPLTLVLMAAIEIIYVQKGLGEAPTAMAAASDEPPPSGQACALDST